MYIQRDIETNIDKWMSEKEIIVILGARRVGKTTLCKHILEQSKDAQSFYIDFEDIAFRAVANKGVHDLINYLKINGIAPERRTILVLDEIQKLHDPSNLLKMVHDHYPEIKLVVTGSSSLDIGKKFSDSLAGRKITFHLQPFNFGEFLAAKEKSRIFGNLPRFIDALESDTLPDKPYSTGVFGEFSPLFEEYLVFGGYPGIVFSVDIEKKSKRLSEIVTGHIEKDIKDISRISGIEGFNKILLALAANVNNEISKTNLARIASSSIHTVEHYISLLKGIFIIDEIFPFSRNKESEITKQSKIYFADNGIRNAILNNLKPLGRDDIGKLTEMFALNHLSGTGLKVNFWRTKGGAEVDFVLTGEHGIVPVEVKSSDIRTGDISRALRSFIEKYSPAKAFILNRSNLGSFRSDKCEIVYFPLFLL